MDTRKPPIFLNNASVNKILSEVVRLAPITHQVYLHGGAIRNAVYYRFFKDKQPQRDFDLIVIGDKETFVNIFLAQGFQIGKKNSATAIVLKKARKENPSEDFSDWVYLDIVFRNDNTITDVLKEKVNFTINGTAIELRYIFENDWFDKIITLPSTLDDLKAKQIKTNTRYSINIYACVRFVSRGFKPPPQNELDDMVTDLRQISDIKFKYNVDKVISYVGSADEVRKIVKKLGIRFDILDLQAIQSQSQNTSL